MVISGIKWGLVGFSRVMLVLNEFKSKVGKMEREMKTMIFCDNSRDYIRGDNGAEKTLWY